MIHREPRKDITKSLIATNVYYDNSAIEIEWNRVLQLVHHYIPEVNMYYRDRRNLLNIYLLILDRLYLLKWIRISILYLQVNYLTYLVY